MSPFKTLFLSFSKMPPVLMLIIILGLSVVVTMYVMGIVNKEQEQLATEREAKAKPVTGSHRRTYYARNYIPANSKIENKQIEAKDVDELERWEDASATSSDIVGRAAKHAIPMNAQIRSSDLE